MATQVIYWPGTLYKRYAMMIPQEAVSNGLSKITTAEEECDTKKQLMDAGVADDVIAYLISESK